MRFIIHQSEDGQWYYELRAINGKTLMVSETMRRKQSCTDAIRVIMKQAANARVEK